MKKPFIYNLIKTECGRTKYNELTKKEGILALLRLSWFILIATIKDWNIQKED
mgnify:CR=1 FL=1